jgi:glucose/arabinose dehydrogenase
MVTTNNHIDLPAPYATPDTKKNSKVIGWRDGKTPVAPEGFIVTKFADSLNSPRWFCVTPNGDILVSNLKPTKRNLRTTLFCSATQMAMENLISVNHL